jgi:hypothetical protein
MERLPSLLITNGIVQHIRETLLLTMSLLRRYALFIMRYLSTQAPKSLTSKKFKQSKQSILDEKGRFICFEGTPGRDAGHTAEASSYFDR